ncbi:MAG: thioredoxin domain-containing protein [Actinomycetota bacterium]
MKEGAAEVNGNKEAGSFRFSPRPNRADQIRWMSWGKAAFNRARDENKLVLLSISAVWCHWCHVMDETSYSDDEVISLVNRRYVPVRVDSDRNPDINRRYNRGGWPTTAFLSPGGDLLAGATYIPPETMRKVLRRMAEIFERQGGNIEMGHMDVPAYRRREKEPAHELVEDVGGLILQAWDREFGGLGTAPKFPQPESIDLALDLFEDGGKSDYLDFARGTLDAMIQGNLLDKVEGGFFRYSTTRDWSVPHYEKMLADNALLIPTLLRAYAVTGSKAYLRTAAQTADYVGGTLSDGGGRFYGSQDADEKYYLLGEEGRRALEPPAVDKTVYTDLASRAAGAFMEAGIVLGREKYTSQAFSALDYLWSECYRAGTGMAHYHDGNPHRWGLLYDQILASRAFILAFGLSGENKYLSRAGELLRIVTDEYWDGGDGILYDMARMHAPAGLEPEPADIYIRAETAETMVYFEAAAGGGTWRETAGRILSGASEEISSFGVLAAPLARAVSLYLRGPLVIRINGGMDNADSDPLRTALLSPLPRLLPLVSKALRDSKAGVEVCSTEACYLHTTDMGELARHLRTGDRQVSETSGRNYEGAANGDEA